MSGLASRTATFVLGDVVGSTRLWADRPDEMREAVRCLDTVVDTAAANHGGERPIEQGEGDSFVITFVSATGALGFAVEVQRALDGQLLAVRMAIHTGEAEQGEDGRWHGSALNRCARLRALAAGGQVLVSGSTAELVVDALPDGASLRDLGRHRLRDLSAAEHVRQLCHADLPADFPALRTLDRTPHNLPLQLTSFVGRDRELADAATLVEQHRLVTLTGAGGSGKTRLALHLAAARLDDSADAVWLADLAGIVDPTLVPSVLAGAMNVAEQLFQPMLEILTRHIADSSTTIVIDNCEHLLDASAELAEHLLRACSGVKILATSREPLGVGGEVVFRVPSLTPADGVQLFVERAKAVRPTFAIAENNAQPIDAICQRLDGLPLAIELAAARVRAMAPAEIARQLSDRFSLLSAGRRGALPRQRTLEASVQWSFDLLTDDERTMLRRLSVFAGGFTLAAAERVVSDDDIDAWDVVDLLTTLVDRSLVQPEDDGERTRYRLLETVRVFAAQRLDEAGEVAATRNRHLAAVAELTKAPELSVELDNVRAALDWATETQQFAAAQTIMATTAVFWALRLASEGYARARTLLERPGADDEVHAYLLATTAWLAWWQGDVAGFNELTDSAVLFAEEIDDARMRARAKMLVGQRHIYDRDEIALTLMAEAIEELAATEDNWFLAFGLFVYSDVLIATGDIRAAEAAVNRGIEVARGVNDPLLLAMLHLGGENAGQASGHSLTIRRHADELRACLASSPGTLLSDLGEALLGCACSLSGDHDGALTVGADYVVRARVNGAGLAICTAGWVDAYVKSRAGRRQDADLQTEVSGLYDLMDIRRRGPSSRRSRRTTFSWTVT